MRNIPVCSTVVQYKELLRKKAKELLRKTRVPSTSSGCTVQEITATVPGLVSVRAAVVQLTLPAEAGSKILTVTESVSQSVTVNCVRSQCKYLSLAIKRVQEPM